MIERVVPRPLSVSSRLPVGTAYLVGVCILVFVFQTSFKNENLLEMDGFWPLRFFNSVDDSIVHSIDPTLLSHAFIHQDLLHLGLNLIALAYFGAILERHLGTFKLLFIFLTGAVCSALFFGLAHVYFMGQSNIVLIGSSGSISAIVGVGAYLRKFFPVLFWIGGEAITALISYSFALPVAYIAHVGGFIAGLVFASLLTSRKAEPATISPTQFTAEAA